MKRGLIFGNNKGVSFTCFQEWQPVHVDLLRHELGRGPTNLAGARYQKSSLGVVQLYGGKIDASHGQRDCAMKGRSSSHSRRERIYTVYTRHLRRIRMYTAGAGKGLSLPAACMWVADPIAASDTGLVSQIVKHYFFASGDLTE